MSLSKPLLESKDARNISMVRRALGVHVVPAALRPKAIAADMHL